MRLTPLTLALSTLSTTSAFISGITLPATIAPNKPYTITFDAKVDPYSMWTDVAVTWGYNSPPGSTNTVPVKPVTTAPDGIQKFNKERKVDIVATVFTVGAITGNVGFTSFDVTVDVGDKVNNKLVSSTRFLPVP
ncbi:hypothetical protein COCHEDRAFT_1221398 [Bipolaris maydis C5]|uniref:Uncharacterized protein n=1 Tax=Cochliobolus heterostrophus (strain C5 / ATCC 48332 / race O) TaxID=701091 RepID=M2UAP5_COCH5|nr:hypothetical protein COCHEDRAFT_1221398 [Bipolaris maydis C5]KAH7561580.1 hypothetical protein BM1_02684 [Bipolaris maydis]KAJ5065397.1 hypothetical protein J3E74DRAFT_414412 [Bipolaris maydis]KAJ6200608.1 hypothetical protein J3E72DRAFT_383152 [Bipolaris maydis]KAJ6213548.1 hypothetical protein PSV09DRAFT_1221398 [Bipolaris maydis]